MLRMTTASISGKPRHSEKPKTITYGTRPFLYPRFTYAHRKIENELKAMEEGSGPGVNGTG